LHTGAIDNQDSSIFTVYPMEFASAHERTDKRKYRGRLAPTPSGDLHVGHAQTFYIAYARSVKYDGSLVFRVEDLDRARCKPQYLPNIIDDLKWFGIQWNHGPGSTQGDDIYSPEFGYFEQSKRLDIYLAAWDTLYKRGYIYPSPHSRKDVALALSAPHDDITDNQDPIFPPSLRTSAVDIPANLTSPGKVNWRFKVPDNETVRFTDNCMGSQQFTSGVDFGDFLVWRSDGFPSYELAVVVDDLTMGITEVVRGCDLLKSTARQLLIYSALGCDETDIPEWFHCPLVCDANGVRLAKRNRPASIRNLRYPVPISSVPNKGPVVGNNGLSRSECRAVVPNGPVNTCRVGRVNTDGHTPVTDSGISTLTSQDSDSQDQQSHEHTSAMHAATIVLPVCDSTTSSCSAVVVDRGRFDCTDIVRTDNIYTSSCGSGNTDDDVWTPWRIRKELLPDLSSLIT
jgi:glutamyl-tRNA synthetase